MKRPILVVLIGYIIGIMWGLYFIKISIIPFIFIIDILIMLLKKQNRVLNVIIKKAFVITITISAIFSNTLVMLKNYNYENLYKGINKINGVGVVVSTKKEKTYKNEYEIKIEILNGEIRKYKNSKIIISISKNYNQLEIGDRISFKGIYEEPERNKNYKGFNYKEYLKTKQIYGKIIVDGNLKIIAKTNQYKLKKFISNISIKIRQNIKQILKDENANMLIGILLGDTELLNDDTKEIFRKSSIYHILAVSGAHITYVILGTMLILKRINIGKKSSNLLCIIVLLFYMFLTGFSASVLRASIMAICMIIADILNRQNDFLNNISISLLITLVINPFAIENIGVLLSYGGTIGIVLFNKRIIKNKYKEKNKIFKSIKEHLAVTISAQIIIWPIVLAYFNTISLSFFIPNFLISYIIGLITILGFTTILISFFSITLSRFIAFLLNFLLNILIKIAEFGSVIPMSCIYMISPNISSVIVYYFMIILNQILYSIKAKKEKRYICKKILNNTGKIKKILIIMIIINMLLSFVNIDKNLEIYFIDVGQGDSCLIITPERKKILIDSGGSETYNVGKEILLPYLLDRKVIKLDYAIISHFDTDHVGGLLYILKYIKVENIIISNQEEVSENYKEFNKITKEKNINVIIVKSGDNIKIEKHLNIKILWPNNKLIKENILNNNSIVAKLEYRNFSMLFTGDIEKIAEREILNYYKNDLSILKSTVLKVAHHGSKTSSTEDFINKVNPKIALIGVGKDNKFGHPNENVIKLFQKYYAQIYRTDINGEVFIKVNRKGAYKIDSIQ